MSDEKQEQPIEEQEQQVGPEPGVELNSGTQAELNSKADGQDAAYWKNRSRGWEQQFRELKAEAAENADAKRHAVEEAKRADDAEAALRAANRELAVLKAAAEANVDAALLARMTGDTPEEIAGNAQMLAEGIKASQAYPAVVDNGSQKQAPMTLADIDAIQDDAQRRAAYTDYYMRNR